MARLLRLMQCVLTSQPLLASCSKHAGRPALPITACMLTALPTAFPLVADLQWLLACHQAWFQWSSLRNTLQRCLRRHGHVRVDLQEGNLHPKDLSSTEGYQRDSFPQFLA